MGHMIFLFSSSFQHISGMKIYTKKGDPYMAKLEIGKKYKNPDPHAGETITRTCGPFSRKIYIPKWFHVLKDNGPLAGLEVHSYEAADDLGNTTTIDEDDNLEPMD